MPADFIWCTKQKGSRVRTKSLPDGKYLHICFYKGKSYAGEVKKKVTLREAKGKSKK